jgi:zona occludens toxin
MINLLVGAPGGGKSYEAVVFHVLAALAKGRKVITNLALDVDAFERIEGAYAGLIEKRTATLAARPAVVEDSAAQVRFLSRFGVREERPFNAAPFSHAEDYGDPWRHPTTGAGPLYVIDECHISLPKLGTPVPVEEWYSLHRHEFADVLLISQSYGKLNSAVRDLIQVVYRVRKNVALGSSGSYTRKVQDGIRGAVVNTSIRRYEKQYFSLYKSHTRSGAGSEMGAADIIPIWRHWSVWAFGVVVLVFVAFVWMNGNPFRMFSPKAKAAGVPGVEASGVRVPYGVPVAVVGGVKGATAAVPGVRPVDVDAAVWPYGALQLHVGGFVRNARKSIMLVVFSQNGQRVFTQNSSELEAAGYKLTALNDCLVQVQFGKLSQFIACDSPSVGIGNAYSKAVPEKTAAADPVPVKR